MGIIRTILAIPAGLMLTGLVTAVIVIRQGWRHLKGWIQQNQIAERAEKAKTQLLEGAKSSPIVQQSDGM